MADGRRDGDGDDNDEGDDQGKNEDGDEDGDDEESLLPAATGEKGTLERPTTTPSTAPHARLSCSLRTTSLHVKEGARGGGGGWEVDEFE